MRKNTHFWDFWGFSQCVFEHVGFVLFVQVFAVVSAAAMQKESVLLSVNLLMM